MARCARRVKIHGRISGRSSYYPRYFFVKGDESLISCEHLKKILQSNSKIAFFGGAGVSTESGIPDFKSPDGLYSGLWRGCAPEEILHTDFFKDHMDIFYQFFFSKMVNINARPNAAHLALASLERAGRLSGVVTQNIDGLHCLAGSVNVAELHGSVNSGYCIICGTCCCLGEMLAGAPNVPKCALCGGVIKPNVVLYGEGLSDETVSKALDIIKEADDLIVGGTSLTVYPAAGLLRYFNGDNLILINKDVTPYDGAATEIIRVPIGEALGSLVFG